MALLRSKGCIYLAWVIIFGNDAIGQKDLRANPFEKVV